jgi:hypothetical protein
MLAMIAAIALAPAVARADGDYANQVALLPLDADQQLDLYGQPVASAIAHELTAGGIDVVVVSGKGHVPKVRLIVDGRIAAGKGDTVVLSIRIRDPDGDVIKTLPVTDAPVPLVSIDKAAAALAAAALPVIRAELDKPPRQAPVTQAPTTSAQPPSTTTAIGTQGLAIAVAGDAALAQALRVAVDPWAKQHHRAPKQLPAPPTANAPLDLVKAVAGETVPLGLALDVVGYTPVAGAAPMARARVRVRIASATQILFDRTIATDTIVGDKAMAPDALAARVAAEVIAILQPHVLRTVPSWGK